MKLLLRLAARSAWNRRFTLGLMLLAIALSTTMLLGIERVRHEVRAGFSQSVSGTDLVVGARTAVRSTVPSMSPLQRNPALSSSRVSPPDPA